ncbi:acyltransferase family protein [Falsiroseomonas ponticola]|uniref:acyltransferase family protein n=1 Tax=Falsiroseomonas ponticola TaxID=2786951 RepID=UPI001932907A|nr:acyltransferase family protein [Roseomonas ponticola]
MSAVLTAQPAFARPVDASAALTRTIEFARVALVIGLVFLHYFNLPGDHRPPFQGIDPEGPRLATFVNGFLTFFFFSAVPLLSAVSGWLFFGGGDRAGQGIGRKLRGRLKSLLLPLVLWNLATLALAILVQRVAPTIGFAQQFNIQVATADAWDYVNAVLGVTAVPIAFQFWFVRDLFVTVLCAPLIWLALRHAPIAGAVVLAAVWAAGFTLGIFIRTDVLFFFYLGALARRRGWDLGISAGATLSLLVAYAALTALRTLAPLVVDMADPATIAWLDVVTRLIRPLGVVACWGVCLQLAATGWGGQLARWGGFAFFLHAAHYPVIALVKEVLSRVMPATGEAWLLAHYGASVLVTLGIVAAAGVLVFRLSPAFYGVLAGGRRLA